MSFLVKYKPLFQVDILHNFFLNKGLEEFDSMSANDKVRQMDRYEVTRFLKVIPTFETAQIIHGHNLVLKMQKQGFTLWSKVSENNVPFIAFSDELQFTFCLQITDSAFLNYSRLNLNKTDQLYYFSNKRLSTESGNFPLINKSDAGNLTEDNFILSEEGQKAELKSLSVSEKQNLFALVRIFVKGEKGAFNLTNAQGKIKKPNKEFKVLFDNRKTTWRYIFENNQTVTAQDDLEKENGDASQLVSKTEQPLTNNGFVSLELGGVELPNPDARMIKANTANTKYYSEIYM